MRPYERAPHSRKKKRQEKIAKFEEERKWKLTTKINWNNQSDDVGRIKEGTFQEGRVDQPSPTGTVVTGIRD